MDLRRIEVFISKVCPFCGFEAVNNICYLVHTENCKDNPKNKFCDTCQFWEDSELEEPCDNCHGGSNWKVMGGLVI